MAEASYDVSSSLNAINRNLGTINDNVNSGFRMVSSHLEVIDGNVDTVNSNVKVIYDEVGRLAKDFNDYIKKADMQHELSVAETRLIKIRQEIEQKFGHHDIVRRTTTGILQADDLGIIKKETITDVTEELMIITPNYWLVPCLVALAAWISNRPELADKALHEAIRRNDEKTSLLFALICRRADRKEASLKWTQRYLANQNPENLDRKTVIILDAFASGLLGADSEGIVSHQITEWLDHLSQRPGFIEQQIAQWSEAINAKRKPFSGEGYTYLKKYSRTWSVLADIMEGAYLHAVIYSYFETIFSQEASNGPLKAQLDEILTSLVTEYDDEELPLRETERLNQFIVDFEGDKKRAQSNMAIEKTAFETRKDFTQLLTDAAMKPESSHSSVSTQKFSIALSRDWISNAYNDVIAKSRMQIPHEIEINIESFDEKTTDGQNEEELIAKFQLLIDREKAVALKQAVLSGFEQFCLWGGITIGGIGLNAMLFGQVFLGLIASIAGIGMVINHFSKKKKVEASRQNLDEQFENKRKTGIEIVRATLAEVVDFRAEFAQKDSESQKVIDFLEQISPDQYVRKLSDSSRRIKIMQ